MNHYKTNTWIIIDWAGKRKKKLKDEVNQQKIKALFSVEKWEVYNKLCKFKYELASLFFVKIYVIVNISILY